MNGEVVKSSSAEKVQPSQTPQEAGTCAFWAGRDLKEEVDPCGSGLPGAEEGRPQQGRTDKRETRTKRGGAGLVRVNGPKGVAGGCVTLHKPLLTEALRGVFQFCGCLHVFQ